MASTLSFLAFNLSVFQTIFSSMPRYISKSIGEGEQTRARSGYFVYILKDEMRDGDGWPPPVFASIQFWSLSSLCSLVLVLAGSFASIPRFCLPNIL